MKALAAAFVLLACGITAAQTKTQCSVLLKADSILYAGKTDETIDSVTVCDDGKATAFHSFTAPELAGGQVEPTKWEYGREIDRNVLSDLKTILGRSDIARLPEKLNPVQRRSAVDVVMHFTVVDHGHERTITLQIPSPACGDHPQMPEAAWDLTCVFFDLYGRVKSGSASEPGCGCESVHDMAKAGLNKSEH